MNIDLRIPKGNRQHVGFPIACMLVAQAILIVMHIIDVARTPCTSQAGCASLIPFHRFTHMAVAAKLENTARTKRRPEGRRNHGISKELICYPFQGYHACTAIT